MSQFTDPERLAGNCARYRQPSDLSGVQDMYQNCLNAKDLSF